MTAWRRYAQRHPHRYSALVQTSGPRTSEAGARLLGILSATLRAYGMDDSAVVHAARCLRAAVHGFAVLEAENAFGLPEQPDESYDLLIRMMAAGLSALRPGPPPATGGGDG
ncbi:WHG domain-containing protein [Streptacidiphilus sp. ASG 303]|nr:WHG domain-containing protein [Streptacidiphilus sp. ASG 303]